METGRGQVGFPDSNIPRQEGVQTSQKSLQRNAVLQLEVCHLPLGMDSRIGSAGSDHVDRVAGHPRQTLLKLALDGRGLGLDLPTVIFGAVVSESDAIS
jgi:hypothetical protein